MSIPAIDVRDLTRRFGSFTAVDHVTFQVEAGEIFGFLGANGAGKSTTIRMLCGLLPPSEGTARVAGFDVAREPYRVRQAIGYMAQKFSLYEDLTGLENLYFFGTAYGLTGRRLEARIREVTARVGLNGQERRLVRELPTGWRQRLALAGALLHEPSVVFLDEPTSGVDPLARRRFWDLIAELAAEGTTVFVTTHYLDEAEYCNRLGLIHNGRLIALGAPEALKARYLIRPLYELEATPLRAALETLRRMPEVFEADPFGSRIHVTLQDRSLDPELLVRRLREAGLTVAGIRPIVPTLEDVFLHLIEHPPTET
ncbi:ABC transporter ATP-binding protein [Rhodothermus marinus]|uniref:ABC transporter ATP-binding protein n=1 Tax=Rhodothermus marinus TaxID=29549 RepID=UPI0012BA40D8|nr:ABC transporter ATP-binding protein [Rhodothermus marinus]BBM70104.1 multidrug ABC transporter ATP-binding protein [Rhodothermus marinus]BBM73090.1 multidrug ABC transporter ATP-binding protein [Rhodothermus marinus]